MLSSRYGWTCSDPISLILGTRFSLILGTRFSILGTRIGSLKHFETPCLWRVRDEWSHIFQTQIPLLLLVLRLLLRPEKF